MRGGRGGIREAPRATRRKQPASPGATHASEDSKASSRVSSPCVFPPQPNPDDFGGRDAPDYHAAANVYYDLVGKYHEKRSKSRKLLCPFCVLSAILLKACITERVWETSLFFCVLSAILL